MAPDDGQDGYIACLGVCRIKGKWGIGVAYYHMQDTVQDYWTGPDNWCPISETSAETRFQYWPHFEKLYQEVVETAEKSVSDYDKAIDEFGDVVAKLK